MIKYEALLKQSQPYQIILKDKKSKMLSNGYMIIGEDSVAVDKLCDLACRIILCQNDDCGVCLNCKRVEDDAHSNIMRLEKFKAEDVRDFIYNSTVAANEEGRKIMVVKEFEKIAPMSQNFFLKAIEEPDENIIFILGVTQASMALDTIKSRCKKMYVTEFDKDLIERELLKEKLDIEKVQTAVNCSFGNLTRAINFATDADFSGAFEVCVDVLTNMQTSKQVADSLIKFNMKAEFFVKYLDCFEIIMKVMLDKNCNKNMTDFKNISAIAKVFNVAMIVNICELVQYARRKLQSNCKLEAVAESLLMGILEVKFKCR